jgi:hypothetical protein
MDRDGAANDPLDMSKDPDRFDAAREVGSDQDRTLPEMLGPGAQEDERNGPEWLAGLVAVLVFLGLTAYLFAKVLDPA